MSVLFGRIGDYYSEQAERRFGRECPACDGLGRIVERIDNKTDSVTECAICCGEGVVYSGKRYKRVRVVIEGFMMRESE